MRRILRPIIVLPALIGIVTSSLLFLTIWERRKANPFFQVAPHSSSSLPKVKMINLRTNNDEYEKLNTGKVLLIFLTTNCNACKKELSNLSGALPSLVQNVAVYGVAFEERHKVDSFVENNQIRFPILIDRGGELVTALDITQFPAKALLENGVITRMWFGSSPSTSALIKDVGEVEKQ